MLAEALGHFLAKAFVLFLAEALGLILAKAFVLFLAVVPVFFLGRSPWFHPWKEDVNEIP